jgi:hypothetical protein
MLKKISLVLSVLATLGFAVVTSAPADAKQQQGGGKSAHVNKNVQVNKNVKVNKTVNKNVKVNKNVQVNKNYKGGKYVVGQRYNGHIWYGHNRHLWHGRWYDYGDGPCWINVDGEWFWNVLACPI